MMGEPRSKTEPQCGLEVSAVNGESVIFLTVPEDTHRGTRVALWTSPKALRRLRAEIDKVLEEITE